jgi:hypothetical protein
MPPSTSMKQGKLSFASSKHTALAGAKKTSAKNQSAVRSDAEGTAEVKEEVKKISIKPRSSSNSLPPEPSKSDSKDQLLSESLPHLNIKDARWRKLFADATAKRNRQPLSTSDVIAPVPHTDSLFHCSPWDGSKRSSSDSTRLRSVCLCLSTMLGIFR